MQESILPVLCCIGLELTTGTCYLIQNSIMYVDDYAVASYVIFYVTLFQMSNHWPPDQFYFKAIVVKVFHCSFS